MPRHLFLRLCVVSTLLASTQVIAEDSSGFTRSLFDGKSLNGWIVTGCEAVVDDGMIHLKSGNGIVHTAHRYRDFILDLEWKALDSTKWDSGIYFRCELPPKGRPWPSRYQANLLKGQEGNVGGVKEATSKGLVNDGEWNRFRLEVVGTKASLEINGKPAWEADGIKSLDGFIALQAEVPGGGQFLFRNINITEVDYRPLFNGKDLTGWEGAGDDAAKCWKVEDGVVVGLPGKGPWLRSNEQFADFNLRLEYKVDAGGNSGVFIRVPESGNHHGKDAGIEIQVLDDSAEKYAKLKPFQYCGSLYGIAPSKQHVGHPPGEWNQLEVNCAGDRYVLTHNGVKIVEADEKTFPAVAERLKKGFLGLQNHGGGVAFRNVRIGPPVQ
jgi:hypothetical protein